MYDLSRPATFETVSKWKKEIDAKVLLPNGSPLPVVLLANKCDLEGVVLDETAQRALSTFCEENGFLGWFETSAKTDHKIDAAARFLVESILSHDEIFSEKQKKRQDAAKAGSLKPGAHSASAPYTESGGCC